MSNLTNSKRVSYTATYNQVSPTASSKGSTDQGNQNAGDGGSVGKAPVQPAGSRPFEKAALVQALDLVPAEVQELRQAVQPAGVAGASGAELKAALDAIAALVADQSPTATMNNVKLFRQIAPAALRDIVKQLIVQRQALSKRITARIGNVVGAYRASLTPVKSAAQVAPAPASAAKEPAAGAVQRSKTTAGGIPVTTTIVQSSSPAKQGQARNASTSLRIHIGIQDGSAVPASYSPVISGTPGTGFTPAASEAIAWAERNAPRQFQALVDDLLPHMRVSQDYLQSVGAAPEITKFLQGRFASRTNTQATQGASSLFDESMKVQPVGSLHLERIEMYPAGVERGELLYSLSSVPTLS
jgi:hypothetical protein